MQMDDIRFDNLLNIRQVGGKCLVMSCNHLMSKTASSIIPLAQILLQRRRKHTSPTWQICDASLNISTQTWEKILDDLEKGKVADLKLWCWHAYISSENGTMQHF